MENIDHDFGDPNCDFVKTIKIIGSKWSFLIIHNLFSGTKRFGQLQKIMHPISPRTLSMRLDELEKEGIIKKQIFAEVPLHVEYSLSLKGTSLKQIFNQMAKWGSHTH